MFSAQRSSHQRVGGLIVIINGLRLLYSKREKAMLFEIQSEKTIDQVCQDLEKAVVNHKFGVMTVHNLKETLKKKGVDFNRECRIFEVCNPQQAKRVLEKDIEVSTALPCRISVYEEGGKTKLATLKPTALIAQ